MAVLIALLTVGSTVLGGLLALRSRDHMHLVLGLSGGLLLGLVTFDLLPEVFAGDPGITVPVALLTGFMLLHVFERALGQHEPLDSDYGHGHEHHPATGVIGAVALAVHVFLDGMALAVAFKLSVALGLAVTVAVVGHAFSDGLNTIALLATGGDVRKRGMQLLGIDAVARVSGAVLGTYLVLDESLVRIYLATFAGALIYLATSHILPEAHSSHPSRPTLIATFVGLIVMFVIVSGTSAIG